MLKLRNRQARNTVPATTDYMVQCPKCQAVTVRSKLVEDQDGNLRCPERRCRAVVVQATN